VASLCESFVRGRRFPKFVGVVDHRLGSGSLQLITPVRVREPLLGFQCRIFEVREFTLQTVEFRALRRRTTAFNESRGRQRAVRASAECTIDSHSIGTMPGWHMLSAVDLVPRWCVSWPW
jgi:hypothetical protein